MKKIIKFLVIALLLTPSISFAQSAVKDAQKELTNTATNVGISSTAGIETQISTIIQLVLGFLGVIFFVLIVIAGIRWMVAGSKSEEVKQAQTSMTNATIGLAIVLFSYLITNFILFTLLDLAK